MLNAPYFPFFISELKVTFGLKTSIWKKILFSAVFFKSIIFFKMKVQTTVVFILLAIVSGKNYLIFVTVNDLNYFNRV